MLEQLSVNTTFEEFVAEREAPMLASNYVRAQPTEEYQTRLFGPYDLSVEFDRQRQLIDQAVKEGAPFKSSCTLGEICPLELNFERSWLREERHPLGGQNCYSMGVYYFGDTELWSMNPGVGDDRPSGEIFRDELILVRIARNLEDGRRLIRQAIDEILVVLEAQARQIDAFNSGIVEYVDKKFVEAGRGSEVRAIGHGRFKL